MCEQCQCRTTHTSRCRFPNKEQVLARLTKAEGNAAQYALDQGLVDELSTYDETIETIQNFAGKDGHDFRSIALTDYLPCLHRYKQQANKPQIGLLVAAGTIVDADNQPGTIGGEALAKQIRDAMYDKISKPWYYVLIALAAVPLRRIKFVLLCWHSRRVVKHWWCRWAARQHREVTGLQPMPIRFSRSPLPSPVQLACSVCS